MTFLYLSQAGTSTSFRPLLSLSLLSTTSRFTGSHISISNALIDQVYLFLLFALKVPSHDAHPKISSKVPRGVARLDGGI